ncbi:MAG TPA: hypothetical protein DCM08_05985 [Microscillaceae bacterium]|nr:hypothetical protein [Microscillaceae bacterium]
MKYFNLYLIMLLVLFAGAFTAKGQVVNLEKMVYEKEDGTRKVVGNVNFNISVKQQRRDLVSFTNLGNVVYITPKHYYAVITNFNLSTVNGAQALNDGLVRQQNNFMRQKRNSPEIFMQWQYDLNRGLVSRWQLGANGRFKLKNVSDLIIAIGVGAFYEVNAWRKAAFDEFTDQFLPDDQDTLLQNDRQIFVDNTAALKGNIYLDLIWAINKDISFNSLTGYQVPFNNLFSLGRYYTDNIIQFKVSKYLAFNTRFSLMYDELPEDVQARAGVRPLIYSLTQGITVKFSDGKKKKDEKEKSKD